MKLSVPESAIRQLSGRNTSEEMAAIREEFSEPVTRMGLVTSAWHLPRALRLAKRNGLLFHPLPADFLSYPPVTKTKGQVLLSLVPRAKESETVARAMKEYLGILIGR